MARRGLLSLSKTAGIKKKGFILPVFLDTNEVMRRMNLDIGSPGLGWMLDEMYPPFERGGINPLEPLFKTELRKDTPLYRTLQRAYRESRLRPLPVRYRIPHPRMLLGAPLEADVNMLLTQGLLIKELEEAGVPVITLARDMAVPVYIARSFGANPLYLPLSRSIISATNPAIRDVSTMILYSLWKKAREGRGIHPAIRYVWPRVFGPKSWYATINGRKVPLPVIMDTGMVGTIPATMGILSKKFFPSILLFSDPLPSGQYVLSIYDLLRSEASPGGALPPETLERVEQRLIDPIEHRTYHPPKYSYKRSIIPHDPDFLPSFIPQKTAEEAEELHRLVGKPILTREGVHELAKMLEPVVGEEARKVPYPVATRPAQYLGATEDEMRGFAQWFRDVAGLAPEEFVARKGNLVPQLMGWSESFPTNLPISHYLPVVRSKVRGGNVLRGLARSKNFAIPWVNFRHATPEQEEHILKLIGSLFSRVARTLR